MHFVHAYTKATHNDDGSPNRDKSGPDLAVNLDHVISATPVKNTVKDAPSTWLELTYAEGKAFLPATPDAPVDQFVKDSRDVVTKYEQIVR